MGNEIGNGIRKDAPILIPNIINMPIISLLFDTLDFGEEVGEVAGALILMTMRSKLVLNVR